MSSQKCILVGTQGQIKHLVKLSSLCTWIRCFLIEKLTFAVDQLKLDYMSSKKCILVGTKCQFRKKTFQFLNWNLVPTKWHFLQTRLSMSPAKINYYTWIKCLSKVRIYYRLEVWFVEDIFWNKNLPVLLKKYE